MSGGNNSVAGQANKKTGSDEADPIDAPEVIRQERVYISERFAKCFKTAYPEYLRDCYTPYVKSRYSEYVGRDDRYGDDDEIKDGEYPARDVPSYGLAISGGGIRSASLAIGVVQALNDSRGIKRGHPTIFEKCSYLSTASGGGYTGSAITWFKGKHGIFPFGNAVEFKGNEFVEDSPNSILSYIRQHGRYLSPPSLGLAALLGSVVASILHSATAYVLIFASAAALLMLLTEFAVVDALGNLIGLGPERFGALVNPLLGSGEASGLPPRHLRFSLFFVLLTLALVGLFLLTTGLYALLSFIRASFAQAHCLRVQVQSLLGWIMRIQAVFLVLAVLPLFAYLAMGGDLDVNDTGFLGAASTSSVLGIALSIWKFRQHSTEGDAKGGILDKISGAVVVLALIVSLLGLGFALGEFAYTHTAGPMIGIGTLLAITLLFAGVVNINQISPHKMYRDRLMETFLKDPKVAPDAPLTERARAANEFTLSEVAKAQHWSPYHLVNTNVILTDAKNPKYHGRCGDSFILSPLFCGSQATRYRDTRVFANGSMTLATAMAISGAALNPHSGTLGQGKTTNPFVSFLLTFFGLRLGYWAINPGIQCQGLQKYSRANYLLPGLLDLFGSGHRENGSFVELSDGGHFDNTGIYELIRRRVAVIVFSDGSADPDMNFDDFGSMVERIRVDFGVLIRFPDEEYNLCNLLPGSAQVAGSELDPADTESTPDEPRAYAVGSECQKKIPRACRGYAVGDIVYPAVGDQPRFVGKIVYIKSTLIPDLPTDIYAYKAANPDFPHQTTADQFFDERQFDSYRELGYRLTKGFLRDEKIQEQLP
ncbi:MAG: hypothetical protein ACPGUC_05070 [Gammaproteobacteria bacterium]